MAVSSATEARSVAIRAKAFTYPVLRRGSEGPAVKVLQRRLNLAGANLAVDGDFGPLTEAAVRAYQRSRKLVVDGWVGPQTWGSLRKLKPKKTDPSPAPAPSPAPGKVTKPKVISAPSPNFSSRNGADIDSIVLHHTASNDTAADLRTLRSRAAQVSAHYLIGRDGKIYQLVNDKMKAWHAGVADLHGQTSPSVNERSIGIEITNKGDGKTPFTEAQYRALEKLVPYLAKTYKVPMRNLVGHKDVAIPRGRKVDPAANFDFERIRRATDKVI